MGLSWSWSYGSWIYIYLCNQCLSPLKLWVGIPLNARCFSIQHYVKKFVSDFGRSVVFSRYSGFLHHDITEILLEVILNTNNPNPQSIWDALEINLNALHLVLILIDLSWYTRYHNFSLFKMPFLHYKH